MSTGLQKFSSRNFWRRVPDLGTGRLPANSALDGKRYLIVKTIGKGGMGAVYLALDTHQRSQQVAIKEMSQAKLLNSQALHRARQSFQQEAGMLARLQHQNLPRAYTSFLENDRSYLVMDFIKGKTLAEALRQQRWNTLLPVAEVVEYGLQLSSVLAYLHTLAPPIMYLDLKPPNIMLREDGRLFLIDFGIARHYQAGQILTEVFYTRGYAPPEHMVGKPELRSDLFALGATLHQCLTGQSPQGHTADHLFEFPPAKLLNPQVPDSLNILVAQMVNIDPDRRPASAAVVQRELELISKQVDGPIVLGNGTVSRPNDVTVDIRYPPFPPMPPAPVPPAPMPRPSHTSNKERLAQLFPQLVPQHWHLGSSLASLGKNRVVPLLVTSVRKPWREAGAIVSNQKIWDQRFAALLGFLFVLTIGGSLALLKTAPDAPHFHVLGLLLVGLALGFIGFHLSGKRLYDPVSRALLALIGLALLCTGLALQGLPDMEAVVHPLIQNATLNQVCILGLLIVAALCLARQEKRLVWADHLLLGVLAAGCALFQYSSGQNALAQIPALTPDLIQYLNPALFWFLLGLMLLAFLLMLRDFGGISRFGLMLVAAVFTALQYAAGFNEFEFFHLTGAPLITLSFAYTWLPVACAVLAWISRRVWLTRVALGALAVAEATMFSYQGQHVFFPFALASPYPLSINILAFSALYELLGPILALVALLALLRLPGKNAFRWLDHGILLLGAFLCARLDDAFWQVQSGLSAPDMNPTLMHQQYTVLAAQLPAYVIYGLLIAFPLVVCAITICHFWQQARPYARIDPWLKRFQIGLIFIDRLLALSMLIIAGLLTYASGVFNLLAPDAISQSFTSFQHNIFPFITLTTLVPLVFLAIVLLVRLLRRKKYDLGNIERLTLLFSALSCLLFTWQDPHIAKLPLLQQHIQFTGNIFHWSPATLHLLILVGLVLTACLALFWLRRAFFINYRNLLNLLFGLVLVSAFLQTVWPIFLPLSLFLLIPGLLLTIQIEKAG